MPEMPDFPTDNIGVLVQFRRIPLDHHSTSSHYANPKNYTSSEDESAIQILRCGFYSDLKFSRPCINDFRPESAKCRLLRAKEARFFLFSGFKGHIRVGSLSQKNNS